MKRNTSPFHQICQASNGQEANLQLPELVHCVFLGHWLQPIMQDDYTVYARLKLLTNDLLCQHGWNTSLNFYIVLCLNIMIIVCLMAGRTQQILLLVANIWKKDKKFISIYSTLHLCSCLKCTVLQLIFYTTQWSDSCASWHRVNHVLYFRAMVCQFACNLVQLT